MTTLRHLIGEGWAVPVPIIALLAVSCAPSDRGAPTDDEVAPIDPERREAVVALGSGAAGELAGSLITRLQAALAEEGPAGAVQFCSVEGLPLTAAVSREVGFEVKRTSSRIRNPANAPDSLEQAALSHFEAEVAAGDSLPTSFVQQTPDGQYRYYQPLRIQPFCLQCHGPPGELGDGVAEVLVDRYPGDRATGYEPGDFRGLVRVTVPASAVERALTSQR